MKKLIAAAATALAVMLCIYNFRGFELIVPDVIETTAGERFCVDDFVEIKGNGKDVTLEYRDNIDINIPGTYTLEIRAENKRGKIVEKNVIVKVVE